ncbi:GNAT family N-acetyltransferase [Streptomyces sp. NPDC007088]|uniref:GNAT family N-acetyltransferase n=1 Tax=Streptomyces sp. NPDC007088 TaxID=3364773 RepID=UPI0036A5C785
MTEADASRVRLEPWTEDDFWLLRAANTPAMTAHLGGPESEEKLLSRHARYLDRSQPGGVFRVVRADTGETAGSIAFWEHTTGPGGTDSVDPLPGPAADGAAGHVVWETGWAILPGHQGRGLASEAARAVARHAAEDGRHSELHAYPRSDHPASNAVCRKAGFTLLGTVSTEYPKGHWEDAEDWCLRLDTL